jgi:1-acyl-sn-glycerol-3-phosphate acyltransferase
LERGPLGRRVALGREFVNRAIFSVRAMTGEGSGPLLQVDKTSVMLAAWVAPMRIALSLFFWIYLVGSLTVFWFAVAVPWLVIAPFDPPRRFGHWYATVWANHFHFVSPFWDVKVENSERIPDDRPVVLVANHQSAADILVLFALKKHFKWVAKASLFNLPLLGWMMRMCGYVPIQRGDNESREKMLKNCQDQLARGSSILIFPEGTRSEDAKMRPFKRGAFTLACQMKVPLVPVVVLGTREALPNKSWIFTARRKALPVVHVLEPLDPAEFDFDAKRLMAQARARMQDFCDDAMPASEPSIVPLHRSGCAETIG